MNLSEVESFGGIDADADDLLRDCFQDHSAYHDAKNHKRFVIVGRKGSGKTAIFQRLLSEKSPDVFSFGHTFDDYPWHHHDLQSQSGVPEERRYLQSWKYLILLSLGKIALNQDLSLSLREESLDSLEVLESFIVDSYGSRDPDVSQLFSPNKEIKVKTGLKTPFLAVDFERIKVSELPIHIQEVNRQITKHTIQALSPDHHYYICFDQLDLGFDPKDSSYSQRLVGLILAARELNRTAKEQGKHLSAVVFLRDDIYELLHFEDKNKITENHVSKIEWNVEGNGLTLRTLMERRFGAVLRGHGEAIWTELFNEERSMSRRQSKYAHICNRTFLRPRDMIKFCNEVLAAYKRSKGNTSGKFDNEEVISARSAYSEYLRNELDDEIAKQVPRYREYLEVIKSISGMQFTAGDFDKLWISRGLEEVSPSIEGLRELFEFSVVGFRKSGGKGGGSKYIWRYMDASARFNPEAETFRVHEGLKETLDLLAGTRVTSK